ncbi:hypothetical protein B0G75_101582 [Paraburkholderia sp. BL18I3N2]|uniref:hypothetical protein n=1 Tax=Paraburkholderia sp. BL18I3N2 TaxID=1938799 RepID=UPI000D04F051|nr:hypothetical protein [Paraburkholderia sp. BL18I3N2]PRX36393.1 hypothetical protein B0G75_101582 [Paraburkholderia sp. BL18I3N2]
MDDRFDRRELLLHLGDILAALNCLNDANEPGATVAQLVQKHASLQDFAFLHALPPTMTATEFGTRVARSFFSWPSELLEADLNRDTLASTVQQNLFAANPDGWNAYLGYVQKKVKWFGTGLSNHGKDALAEPSHDVPNEVSPFEAPAKLAPAAEVNARGEKRGWPWPEPRSKS